VIGFVVEGPSDEKVLLELAKKINIKIETRVPRPGGGTRYRKIKRFATDLLNRKGCKKVCFLKDSHCSSPEKIKDQVLKEIGRGIKICIVVHAIESWLLADEKAIEDYLQIKIKPVPSPEHHCKPDDVLDDLFRKAGKRYFKGGKDPAEIAKRLNLNQVQKKCTSFRNFLQVIHDC